jgi:hypothetical protein
MNEKFLSFEDHAGNASYGNALGSDQSAPIPVLSREYGYSGDDESMYSPKQSSTYYSKPYHVVSSASPLEKRRVVYPWGVNPVQSRVDSVIESRSPLASDEARLPQLLNRSSVYGELISDTRERNYQGSMRVNHSNEDFVDTSPISTSFEPLLEILKSFFSFFSGSEQSSSSLSESESDIEVGLRTPCSTGVESSVTSQATLSSFDVLHSSPIRFPSSITELLGESPLTSLKKYPIPDSDPPLIPPLPVPKLRTDL